MQGRTVEGMAARIDLTLDCDDAPLLAAFWKTALGYVDDPPPAPFATRAEWIAHYDPEGNEFCVAAG